MRVLIIVGTLGGLASCGLIDVGGTSTGSDGDGPGEICGTPGAQGSTEPVGFTCGTVTLVPGDNILEVGLRHDGTALFAVTTSVVNVEAQRDLNTPAVFFPWLPTELTALGLVQDPTFFFHDEVEQVVFATGVPRHLEVCSDLATDSCIPMVVLESETSLPITWDIDGPSIVQTADCSWLLAMNTFPNAEATEEGIFIGEAVLDDLVNWNATLQETLSVPGQRANDPVLAMGGRLIIYDSGEAGDGDLYYATRATTNDDWSTPVAVPGVNLDTSTEMAPEIAEFGTGFELFFTSDRGTDAVPVWRTYRAVCQFE